VRLALGLFLSLFTLQVSAQALLLSELAGDAEVPRTFGLSVEYFGLEQDYDLDSLTISVPFPLGDLSDLELNSDTDYIGVKFDFWLLPFLNVFLTGGQLDGNTFVGLSDVSLPGLPIQLNDLNIDIDGDVFGGGITLAYANDKWFGSITASYTDTNLDGDFASSIEALSIQPKIGRRFENFDLWVGALYLDTDESHSGVVDLGLGFLGAPLLQFDVVLAPEEDINFGVGGIYRITDRFDAIVDLSFGDRETQYLSLTYRF